MWVKLAVDVEGRQLLSVIDSGSRYPEVVELSSTNSAGVIDKFMEVFARFGLPSTLVSDNGPQFASEEMKTWHRAYQIQPSLPQVEWHGGTVPQSIEGAY